MCCYEPRLAILVSGVAGMLGMFTLLATERPTQEARDDTELAHHLKAHDITTMQRQKLRSHQKNGRSPGEHSIGKFFLCYIVLFSSETSAPGSPGNYLYYYVVV